MSELNNTRKNNIEDELATEIKNGQREYKKMLNQLCPSKEIQKQAKRILHKKYSCGKCAYFDEKTSNCRNPHKNMYNIFLDIDHCYEGILRYLVKENAKDEKIWEAEAKKKDEIIAELTQALKTAIDIEIKNMEITRTFARWLILMTDGNRKLPIEIIKCVRETLDWLNESLRKDDDFDCDKM